MKMKIIILLTLGLLVLLSPQTVDGRPPRNNTRLCEKNPTLDCDCIKLKMSECKEMHHERTDARFNTFFFLSLSLSFFLSFFLVFLADTKSTPC